jgi:hypothetical protein
MAPVTKNGRSLELSLGRAVALICSGAGIMLLLNCCICFTVNNLKQNKRRRSNRNSSIIRRPLRSRSVSFSDPLVTQPGSNQKRTRFQSSPRPLQEIEMVDLGPSRAQSNLPPPAAPSAPAPLPLRPKRTAAPNPTKVSRPTVPPPSPPSLNRNRPTQNVPVSATLTRQIQPVRRAPPVPVSISATIPAQPTFALDPLGPSNLTRTMSVRRPHRD